MKLNSFTLYIKRKGLYIIYTKKCLNIDSKKVISFVRLLYVIPTLYKCLKIWSLSILKIPMIRIVKINALLQ